MGGRCARPRRALGHDGGDRAELRRGRQQGSGSRSGTRPGAEQKLLDATGLLLGGEVRVVLGPPFLRAEGLVGKRQPPEDGLHLALESAEVLAEEAIGVKVRRGRIVGLANLFLVGLRRYMQERVVVEGVETLE